MVCPFSSGRTSTLGRQVASSNDPWSLHSQLLGSRLDASLAIRWPTCSKCASPWPAFADSVLARESSRAPALFEVLPDPIFPTDQCQPCFGVWLHALWALGLLVLTTIL